jgi:hypothetical protein
MPHIPESIKEPVRRVVLPDNGGQSSQCRQHRRDPDGNLHTRERRDPREQTQIKPASHQGDHNGDRNKKDSRFRIP